MNEEQLIKNRILFGHRFLVLLAVGALWFVFALFWVPFFWLGLFHNLFLVALALVDRTLLGSAEQVRVVREFNEPLSLGASNLIRILVSHNGTTPLQLEVRDEPPLDFGVDKRQLTFKILPGGKREIFYHVTPYKRGLYRFENLNVRYVSPFQLLILQKKFDQPQEARVYPNMLEAKKHRLLAQRNQLTQMGLRVSRHRGGGMEFESLRDFVPDDELRKVDWKASARRGSLVAREYNVERSRNLVMMLDCGRVMASFDGDLTKLDHAVNAAMLLTYASVQHDDRVGLLTFADDVIGYLPPGRGKGQMDSVVDKLYGIQPEAIEPDYRRAMLFMSHRLKKRSLIVLFTDLVDPDSSHRLIRSLSILRKKHLVLCVAIRELEWDQRMVSAPQSEDDLYRQAVAISVLEDRKRALLQLASTGVHTLDATQNDLSIQVLNRYLKIKQEAML
jgi:uncharacterized protein (DUF58 family)